jgi:hypothetical protein
MVQKGESVPVHYYGATVADGKKFDSSFGRGTTFKVPVGASSNSGMGRSVIALSRKELKQLCLFQVHWLMESKAFRA